MSSALVGLQTLRIPARNLSAPCHDGGWLWTLEAIAHIKVGLRCLGCLGTLFTEPLWECVAVSQLIDLLTSALRRFI